MNDIVIAYQGVEGAYSHLACKRAFSKSISIACDSFISAMKLVEAGTANLAMIPLENSTAGRVEEIYRLIPKLSLYIVQEHFEPVKHCLLGINGAKIEDLKYVSSHPQALAQCHKNITNLNLIAQAKFDTAGSAKEISELQNKKHGAIASSLANAVPLSGCFKPNSWMKLENSSLSSARSITFALVPAILAPIAVRFLASLSGVCPPK